MNGARLGHQLIVELHGQYKPVYDALLALEAEFVTVGENQKHQGPAEDQAMFNTQAHLLWTTQGALPEERRLSRKQIRHAIMTLRYLPGMHGLWVDKLLNMFSATIYCVEHVFFLNREFERRIEAGEFKFAVADAVYPHDRIQHLLNLSYEIWRSEDVLHQPPKERFDGH